MKNLLKMQSLFAITLLTLIMFLGACKKDSNNGPDPDPDPSEFPLTNLALTLTEPRDQGGTNPSYQYNYEIKNVSNIDYVRQEPSAISIRFTITTTDGTSYEGTSAVSNLKAGKTYISDVTINYSPGKKVDPTKNKVVLYYQ